MSLSTAAARLYCFSRVAAVRPLVRAGGDAISEVKYGTCSSSNSRVSLRLLHKSIDRHMVRLYGTSGTTVPTSSTSLSSSASVSSVGGEIVTGAARVWRGARWPAWRRNESRRDMSTRKRRPGEDPALTDPTRQDTVDEDAPKAPTLGKGQDLMSDDPDARPKCVIAGYDIWGFQIADGVDVRGSMIALPNSYLLWAPKRFEDITIESLRLLELVRPKIDLLVIGVGERITERLDPKLMKHFASKGILIEQLDSVNACSTFNVLNAEDRRVAAAILVLSAEEPPLPADFDAENNERTT